MRHSFVTLGLLATLPVGSCLCTPESLYERYEAECLELGWNREAVSAAGLDRHLLWREPDTSWSQGAVVFLHGGGGTSSNICAGPDIGEPVVQFSDAAVRDGFAVFSLESGDGLLTDADGNSCGKRWDFLSAADDNRDLAFIRNVLDETIPGLRPAESAEEIYLTGISNGGYMLLLAATHFDDRVRAFAPVSSGDPYGTHVDCDEFTLLRPNAPGLFLDNETGEPISAAGACAAGAYPGEREWHSTEPPQRPSFKLLYHRGDSVCDLSCKLKATELLSEHGYRDAGSFVTGDAEDRRVANHYWIEEYNRPLLDFFGGDG